MKIGSTVRYTVDALDDLESFWARVWGVVQAIEGDKARVLWERVSVRLVPLERLEVMDGIGL